MTLRFGWRFAFVAPGACGLIWVSVWLLFYRRPKQSYDDLPTAPQEGQPLRKLLRNRNVLGLFFARMLADPVWYFYLFWIPEYLKRVRGFSLAEIGLYAWIPFVAADLGGLFAGFCSDGLIRHGIRVARARRLVLYGAAAVAPLGILTSRAASKGVAIALISAAGFVCFVWFINTATLVSDVFDEGVVGSVQGLIGSAGSAGGVLFNMLTGFVVSHFGYSPIFALAASLHVLAALVIWGFMRDTSSTISSRIGMATASNVSF